MNKDLNKPSDVEIDTKLKRVFIDGKEINCISNISFNWVGGLSEVKITFDANVKLKGDIDKISTDYKDLKVDDMYKINKKDLLGDE